MRGEFTGGDGRQRDDRQRHRFTDGDGQGTAPTAAESADRCRRRRRAFVLCRIPYNRRSTRRGQSSSRRQASPPSRPPEGGALRKNRPSQSRERSSTGVVRLHAPMHAPGHGLGNPQGPVGPPSQTILEEHDDASLAQEQAPDEVVRGFGGQSQWHSRTCRKMQPGRRFRHPTDQQAAQVSVAGIDERGLARIGTGARRDTPEAPSGLILKHSTIGRWAVQGASADVAGSAGAAGRARQRSSESIRDQL